MSNLNDNKSFASGGTTGPGGGNPGPKLLEVIPDDTDVQIKPSAEELAFENETAKTSAKAE